jgi:hypothetical protein
MTVGILVLVTLSAFAIYAGVRSLQHRELEKAYRFAHEATHDTDRGYFPDEYTGLGLVECQKIADRFREAEQKWWMFGANRERARAEVRMASWIGMAIREVAP